MLGAVEVGEEEEAAKREGAVGRGQRRGSCGGRGRMAVGGRGEEGGWRSRRRPALKEDEEGDSCDSCGRKRL